MSTKSSRIIYDRKTLFKIKSDVMENDEILKPIKEKVQRITITSHDGQGRPAVPYTRRRFTSFNSDETGNSEELGEWIDATSRSNSAKTRSFNPGFRNIHRGAYVPRTRNWKNFDLEPLVDTSEENHGFSNFQRKATKPPGLGPIKWFYIDLELKERGPFPSSQMLEWSLAGFLSHNLKIRRSFDQYYRTIAFFSKTCNGGNPFEVNTLSFIQPILSEEEESSKNVVNLPPAIGINNCFQSKNFWYYLSDLSTLQGPFSGTQMQEWLDKKLIYPTLRVRRIDQQNFYELGSLIKIVPDAFTNENLGLNDLNSLLEASCLQENTLNSAESIKKVPNQNVQKSMDLLEMSSANAAKNIKNQILDTLESRDDLARIESDMRAAQLADRVSFNDQIGNAVENRSKFWYFMANKKIQGPFTGKEMDFWYRMNYFPNDLLVRKGDKIKFQPLREYLDKVENPFDDRRVFKFGDVTETQPIMKVSSPCTLCNNDECEFRGLDFPSAKPEMATIDSFQIKTPCIRKPKFRCNHADSSDRSTTLNDQERSHEIILPTNPPILMVRTFVKLRHCQEDDYEYSTISTIMSTIPSSSNTKIGSNLASENVEKPLPQQNHLNDNNTIIPQMIASDNVPKQSHVKQIRHNHVNLNDSLLNNIQFVFGSPNSLVKNPNSNENKANQESLNVPPPPPPPVQVQLRKNSSAWNGETVSRLNSKISDLSSTENFEVNQDDGEWEELKSQDCMENDEKFDQGMSLASKNSSSKKKKKQNSKKKSGDEPQQEASTTTVSVKESIKTPPQPLHMPVAQGNANPKQSQQQNKSKKGKKSTGEASSEKPKPKKESKQEAWDAHFQRHVEAQAQKIQENLAAERELALDVKREEEEIRKNVLKAAKQKNAQIAQELRESEKLEAQLSQITLPKNVTWANKSNNKNGNNSTSLSVPKISFSQIQAQQSEEERKNKLLMQNQQKQSQNLSGKKSTWSNIVDSKSSPIVPATTNQRVEINFHESQSGPKTVNANKQSQNVIQVVADIPKKVNETDGAKKKAQKPQQQPISIWNISDPNAIKKAAKTIKAKSEVTEKPVQNLEPLKLPEMPSEVNKKRKDLITWCSKQMITLKQYTKIQSIDSETMATLLCDLDSKDDVSKFVEECFGKSKVCEKFVKDFSQKKNRLLKV